MPTTDSESPARHQRARDRSVQRILGAVLAGVVLLAGLTAPAPAGLDPSGQQALAVLLFSVVLWLTKPVPLALSSVLTVALLFGTGAAESFAAAASGFASRLVFFLLLLFLLGGAVSTVGLADRIAARLQSSSDGPRQSFWMLAANVLAVAFVMPSGIARTVTFAPIAERISDRYGDRNLLRGSLLLLGQVNPIASLALMTGGGMAILASELILAGGESITWLSWALYMIPPVVFVYVAGAGAIRLLYPPATHSTDSLTATHSTDSLTAASPQPDTGSLSREQRLVGAIIAATIAGWAIGSLVGLSPLIPPLVAVTVLAAPGVDVIDADDVKQVSWGVLLLFGAMLSLIEILNETGAIAWVVDQLLTAVPLRTLPTPAGVAALLGAVVFIRLFFSTASACLAVSLPIVLAAADPLGVSPLLAALAVVLLVGSTSVLPFHMPPVLIVAERGPIGTKDVFTVGLSTLVAALVAIAIAWTFYWPMLD